MLDGLIGALLSAVILGIVTLFHDELRGLFTGQTSANRDLIGDWTCVWSDETGHIRDHVEIRRISGGKIAARGRNIDRGAYELQGTISAANVLTLTYSGEGERAALGGVAILEVAPTRKCMTGRWCQYEPERRFLQGSTEWRKS